MTKKFNQPTIEAKVETMEPPIMDKVIDFVTDNLNSVLYAGLGLLLLISILFFFFTPSKGSEIRHVAEANQLYHTLLETPKEEVSRALTPLTKLLNQAPDLKMKYTPLVAQALLSKGLSKEAEQFAPAAFERLQQNGLASYESFAKSSLNSSVQGFEALKESLSADQTSTLYAATLLELSALYQKVGRPTDEKAAIEELLGLDSPAASRLLLQVRHGELSLGDYLKERVKAL